MHVSAEAALELWIEMVKLHVPPWRRMRAAVIGCGRWHVPVTPGRACYFHVGLTAASTADRVRAIARVTSPR